MIVEETIRTLERAKLELKFALDSVYSAGVVVEGVEPKFKVENRFFGIREEIQLAMGKIDILIKEIRINAKNE